MLDMILEWVAEGLSALLTEVLNVFMPVVGFSQDVFIETFPFAKTGYEIFQGIGLGIILLLAASNLLPFFFNAGMKKESPVQIVISVIFAVFAIYMGNYLLEGIVTISLYPYTAILNEYGFGSPASGITFSSGNFLLITTGLSLILTVIVSVLIGWNMIKLVFEVLQRYILLFVLMYASPLPFSTLALPNTAPICKRFITMFISQCLILILQAWTLKLCISGLSSHFVTINPTLQALMLLAALAILKIGQKLDTYLSQMGVTTATIGGNMLGDLLGAGALMLGAVKTGINMSGKFGTSGSSANVLGEGGRAAGGGNAVPLGGTPSAYDYAKAGVFHSGSSDPEDIPRPNSAAGKANFLNAVSSSIQALHNGAMSEEQRIFSVNNPYAAGHLLNSYEGIETTSTEPRDFAAVAEGVGGVSNNRSLREAIDVARGAAAAENVQSKIDDSGATISYNRNGKRITQTVANRNQLRQSHADNMSSFQQFTGRDGLDYYYRYQETSLNRNQGPSKAEQARIDLQSSIDTFAADPYTGTFSNSMVSDAGRNQDIAVSVFEKMGEYNTQISFTEPKSRDITPVEQHTLTNAAQMFDSLNFGMSKGQKDKISSRIRAGEIDSFHASEYGMDVKWTNTAGKTEQIILLNDKGLQANGMDENSAYNKEMTHTHIGGKNYYWRHNRDVVKPNGDDPVKKIINAPDSARKL